MSDFDIMEEQLIAECFVDFGEEISQIPPEQAVCRNCKGKRFYLLEIPELDHGNFICEFELGLDADGLVDVVDFYEPNMPFQHGYEVRCCKCDTVVDAVEVDFDE